MSYVKLISYTPNPERTVAAAARLCYSPRSATKLYDDLSEKEIAKLIRQLRKMGHTSTFEHASFTFAIEGISRVLSHQLVRHRIASYSQKSQRYVSEEKFDFVIPPSIKQDANALQCFTEKMDILRKTYHELCKIVPKEDARYILPNATETKVVATFNARSLHNFFRLRCCARAQWEIQILANQMLALVQEVAPNLFANAGPSCVSEGVCHEGALSCGRLKRQGDDKKCK